MRDLIWYIGDTFAVTWQGLELPGISHAIRTTDSQYFQIKSSQIDFFPELGQTVLVLMGQISCFMIPDMSIEFFCYYS